MEVPTNHCATPPSGGRGAVLTRARQWQDWGVLGGTPSTHTPQTKPNQSSVSLQSDLRPVPYTTLKLSELHEQLLFLILLNQI